VPQDNHAVAVKVLVEGDPVGGNPERFGECSCGSQAARREGPVRRARSDRKRTVRRHGREAYRKRIEYREAALIDHDGLAVDQAIFDWKAFDNGHDLRVAVREIERARRHAGVTLSPYATYCTRQCDVWCTARAIWCASLFSQLIKALIPPPPLKVPTRQPRSRGHA
jgi:hypothetical protein